MSDVNRNEEAIFLVAVEIASTEERNAYLEEACGENEQLRKDIEALLAADAKTGDLLSAPDAEAITMAPESHLETAGDSIGPYKLLEQIGEGGMGSVYMAEQRQPVRRRVALKIIKPGMDSKLVIARFEAERQALAMMDHQNIARVYDAGTTDSGRPYFVMELVKGIPITEYCERNQLAIRDRIELFIAVCQALRHSHQKGIIHRDIKPSNVLVCTFDGVAVPKVIDFGVAKAIDHRLTEKTLFTQHGQVVGTLEYMSPEQAELSQNDIDTRSDVYSLGILLYELLTGTTPITKEQIRSTAFVDVLRSICEDDVDKPSSRLKQSSSRTKPIGKHHEEALSKKKSRIKGELDWIVLKALEKKRSRRYETAKDLADDLKRFLHDQPVSACPPSLAYRAQKFSQRNSKLLKSIAVLSLIALTAVTMLWWSNHNQRRMTAKYEMGLAINEALRGNLVDARMHISNAEVHGADIVWYHMLRGIVALYEDHGSNREAVIEFQLALAEDPDNISVKSLLATAHVWAGDWTAYALLIDELKDVQPDADNVEDHFFLGQAIMFVDSRRAVNLMKVAREAWRFPPMVETIYAEALGHAAWDSGDYDTAVLATETAKRASLSLPNSPFARAVLNWTIVVATSIAFADESPEKSLLTTTTENIEFLSTYEDYIIGYQCRAWYFHLNNEEEQALQLWRTVVEEKDARGYIASAYAAEVYRLEPHRIGEVLALLGEDPNDADLQFARAQLLLEVDPVDSLPAIQSMAKSLSTRSDSERALYAALMIYLRIGDLESAKDVARDLKTKVGKDHQLALDVVLGIRSVADATSENPESWRVECRNRMVIGLYHIANNELEFARDVFQPAVDRRGFMMSPEICHWLRALDERLAAGTL